MKRIHVIVDGYVQKVGYREHVRKEAVKSGITGYVKNLDTEEVEIVAEGREEEIHTFIKEINISHYPIQVTSFNVEWGDATGEWKRFNIIRGDIQEETFERMDYAGMIMHEILDVSKATLEHTKTSLQLQSQMLEKQDQTLGKQDQMLEKQDQMHQTGKETKEEIIRLRQETGKCLDDEFKEIKKKLHSIEDALSRAGIQV